MKIRAVRSGDYQALRELWSAAGLTFDVGDSAPDFLWALSHGGQHYLAGEMPGGHLAGSVLGAFDGRRGWIYHLAVHPSYQRQGFGRMLMQAAENSLRGAGCLKINLLVEPHNLAVGTFYQKIGYRRADNLFMEKIIH